MELAHQDGGDGGSGGDASAQVLEAFVFDGAIGEELELGAEHGGDAVEGGGALFLDGEEGGGGREGFAGEDDRGAVRGGGHVAEDGAEAVVEGGRGDDDVGGGEAHAHADEVAVVEDGGVA